MGQHHNVVGVGLHVSGSFGVIGDDDARVALAGGELQVRVGRKVFVRDLGADVRFYSEYDRIETALRLFSDDEEYLDGKRAGCKVGADD